MNLSKFFTRNEFEYSQTAARKGIDNTMPQDTLDNAILLCRNVLDPIRAYYNKPVIITSGYRCKKINRLIGGSLKSQHCYGKAADFKVLGEDLKRVFNDISQGKIALEENYDQLIFEFGSWIHISRDTVARTQKLLASSVNNKVVYSSIETIA